MTPDTLATLHATCFPEVPWSAESFAQFLGSPTTRLITAPNAFLLAQVIAPEAEILTLCVAPSARRQGTARQMIDTLKANCDKIFLEVASDNAAARALYAKAGFIQTGLRPAYYPRTTGLAADALTLTWTTPQPSWF